MSDLQDTNAANDQDTQDNPVVKISPVRIITAIGKGSTADQANLAGAAAFEEQMLDYQDTITGNVVVINSGCNVIYHTDDNFEIQYWATVRVS